MNFIERLMSVGYPIECAERITASYIAQGDIDGLEDYITALEASDEVFPLPT